MNNSTNAGVPSHTEFRAGDEVVLAEGTYQGTPGIFVCLRADPKWADITERNGVVREHPVEWLAHAAIKLTGAIAGHQG